jgi:predicted transcriptional regulator
MEVQLSSDLERKLALLANERGRDSESLAADLVSEAVERMSGYDDWFLARVDEGLAQVAAGKTLSHEAVGKRLESYLSENAARVEARDR